MSDSEKDYTIDYYINLADNGNAGLMRNATEVVESYNILNELFKNVDDKPVFNYATETQIKAQAELTEAIQYVQTMIAEASVAMDAVTVAGAEVRAFINKASKALVASKEARALGNEAVEAEAGAEAEAAYAAYDRAAAVHKAALEKAKTAMAAAAAAEEEVKRWNDIEAAAARVRVAAAEVLAVVPVATSKVAIREDNTLIWDDNPGAPMKYGGPAGSEDQPFAQRMAKKRLERSEKRVPLKGGRRNTKKYRRRNKRKTKHYKRKTKRYTKKRNMRY